MDDPWDWSVDRVIRELCTEERSWEPSKQVQSMPDLQIFGDILQEEEVTGTVLLTDVDEKVLKEDLKLKKLGQRSFVTGAIQELRLKSLKYQIHHNRVRPEPCLTICET